MTAYTEVAGGDPIYAITINDIIRATINKPIVKLVQTVAQTGLTSNAESIVTFSTDIYDPFGYHSTSSNTSRITPTKAGVYEFTGAVCVENRTNWELLYAYFKLNGSTALAPGSRLSIATAITGTRTQEFAPASLQYEMNGSTDYMELAVFCVDTSGTTYSTIVSGAQASVFQAEYLRGPQ